MKLTKLEALVIGILTSISLCSITETMGQSLPEEDPDELSEPFKEVVLRAVHSLVDAPEKVQRAHALAGVSEIMDPPLWFARKEEVAPLKSSNVFAEWARTKPQFEKPQLPVICIPRGTPLSPYAFTPLSAGIHMPMPPVSHRLFPDLSVVQQALKNDA